MTPNTVKVKGVSDFFVFSSNNRLQPVSEIDETANRTDKSKDKKYQGRNCKEQHHILPSRIGPYAVPIENDDSAE
jgi:hypothetical protein